MKEWSLSRGKQPTWLSLFDYDVVVYDTLPYDGQQLRIHNKYFQ